MMNLDSAKLLGMIFESMGYGEYPASTLVPCACLYSPLATGIFLVMFACNAYLQMRNLTGKNPRRPNLVLVASSTVLFILVTVVSYFYKCTPSGIVFSCLCDPSDGLSGLLVFTRPSSILGVKSPYQNTSQTSPSINRLSSPLSASLR